MNQDKRKTVPPTRLTYSGPGRQDEVIIQTVTNPKTVADNKENKALFGCNAASSGELLKKLDDHKRIVEQANAILEETTPVFLQFDGRQEDTMTEQEVQLWRKTRTDYNNASHCLKMSTDRIKEIRSLIRIQERKASGSKASVKDSGASYYSSRSNVQRIRQLELDREARLLEIQEKFEDEIAQVDYQVEEIKLKISTNPDTKDVLEPEVKLLELKKRQLMDSLSRKEKFIKQKSVVAVSQVITEDEDSPDDLSDDEAAQSTGTWVVHNFHNHARSNFNNENKHYSAEEHQHPIWNDSSFTRNNTDPFWQQHVHSVEPQTDKDLLMIQLLEKQLELMQRPNPQKDWDPRDLPIFSGKAEEWPIFKGEFDRTTPPGKVNSSQNAIRLRKALTGLAKEAVSGLLHDPANIQKVMRTLEENFGRKDLVLKSLMRKAEGIKSPDNQRPETFVSFGRVVQTLVETAKGMKDERYLNDIGMLEKLVSKLPMSYSCQWMRWITDRPMRKQDLASFGDWVEDMMAIMVRLVQPQTTDQSGNRNQVRIRGSASINVASTSKDNEAVQHKCSHCGKSNHVIAQCFRFKKESPEVRINFVKDNNLCFRCLESGHSKKDCTSDLSCTVEGCSRQHHTLIHGNKYWKKKGSPKAEQENTEASKAHETTDENVTIGTTVSTTSKPLSVVRVRVQGPKGTRKVFALLDSGASRTVIDSKLAMDLGMTGKQINHVCRGVGGITISASAQVISMKVSGVYSKAQYYTISDAITMKLGLPPHTQDAKSAVSKWPYLRKARLENFTDVVPLLIIGEDNPALTAHRNILERGENEPLAKRTYLGWVLGGKAIGQTQASSVNVMSVSAECSLDDILRESYSMDSFGVVPKCSGDSVEDTRALQILEQTVQKKNGVWECGLLWKSDSVKFPESRPEAIARLIGNEKRMRRDPVFFDMYHKKIDEYVRKGYVRRLEESELQPRDDRELYIPHFANFNINKPGKLRLVFDAACRSRGVSLNDQLSTGPDFIRPLPTVLMNFRRHNIAIQGDIEDMFHRVSVRKEDRCAQRFLWRDLRDSNGKIQDYEMNVLIFGATSSPASAIFVKNRNAKDFLQKYPEAAKSVEEEFYIDDCLTGAETVERAIQLRKEICEINAAGNFNVKKWLSNSSEVIASVPEEDRAPSAKSIGSMSSIPTERVLGLWWNPDRDSFTFSANLKKVAADLLNGKRPTKRELCSVVMSLFDPLGFIANMKIKGGILLQQTWRSGVDWDEMVTEEVYSDWLKWLDYLKEIPKIQIPRCYSYDIHLAVSVELHVMVDSSEEASACVAYLRIFNGNQSTVAFVAGRAKVAPVKKLTIPRLELLAAVMGATLGNTISSELKINIARRFFWSDSRTVLLWIRSETLRFKEFVANRISRIHELTNVSEWRWVPTDMNAADDATRLKTHVEMCSSSRWLTGPEFLAQTVSDWPKENSNDSAEGYDKEMKRSFLGHMEVQAAHSFKPPDVSLLDAKNFSSFTRLVRVRASVEKAAKYWIAKWRKSKNVETPWRLLRKEKLPAPLSDEGQETYMHRVAPFIRDSVTSVFTPEELSQAEEQMAREVQKEAFGKDYCSVVNGKVVKSNKLWKLSPFAKNGILRVKGRLQDANVGYNTKNPIILPGKHRFTELLILREHERNAHQGLSTILNNLRGKYWIVEGKTSIKRACNQCLSCYFRKAKPMVPEMGNLPICRVAGGSCPFTHTGMDLFGPLEVTVGRHREKRWVYLFTCMVTRAIHLEVVYGLSTDETLMALSRFVDQRGRPQHLYSDNGTNFVGANRTLKETAGVNINEIRNKDLFQEMHWHFNPPGSAHFGGTWERMVSEVKKVLKRSLADRYPKDQLLLTVLKGAENIINSRPLSHATEDPTDSDPLTPNHFLRGFCNFGPELPEESENQGENARMQWKRVKFYLERIWQRWTHEVLPELNRRVKWQADRKSLATGDLVLLVDEQQPRNTWTRGVISSTFPGKDGRVRVVEVRTYKGSVKIYKRGVDKIIPLGLRMEN